LSAAREKGQEPTALLLDEATSNPDGSDQMLSLSRTRDETDAGRIVIGVLHDLNSAVAWADTNVLISDGRIVAEALMLRHLRIDHNRPASGIVDYDQF
jgi:iron complex transport system ATP-binding protein